MNRLTFYFLFLSFLFSACEDVDLTGIFIPEELANQRFEKSMRWDTITQKQANRTCGCEQPVNEIVVQSDDYKILVMADNHVGETKNLDIFSDTVTKTTPAAVVVVGDMVNGHKDDYDNFESHFTCRELVPSFFLAGNHDLNFEGRSLYYERFGSSTYYFTIKTPVATDLYICLENASATLGKKQIDWLCRILQNRQSTYRYCFVFIHSNLFHFRQTESTSPLIEELEFLLVLFAKNNVNMVIAAHDHRQDDKLFGKTRYIVMNAIKDGLPDAGYFKLNIKSGRLEYQFVNL